jgi:hypothetical protein
MEVMDFAKVITSKKRDAEETGPQLSSNDETRAQFSTVRNRKKQGNLKTIA